MQCGRPRFLAIVTFLEWGRDMRWSKYLHTAADLEHVALFNACTGAFARIRADVACRLGDITPGKEMESADCPPSLFASLVHGGFVVPSWDDEYSRIRLGHESARSSMATIGLTVVPTLNCNLQCLYCFESRSARNMDPSIQEDLVRHVEQLLAQGSSRHVQVTWYGGEPLLHVSAVTWLAKTLRDACDKKNATLSSSMITNGTLLSAATAAELRDLGVRRYQVTLDGLAPTHNKRKPMRGTGDSFETIISNLKGLVDLEGITLSLRMNVDRENLEEVEPLLQYLVGEGIVNGKTRTFYIAPVQDWGQGGCTSYPQACYIPEEEFAALEMTANEQVYRRFGFEIIRFPAPTLSPCGAISPQNQVVGPGGEFYRCWTDVGMSEWVTGHVRLPGVETPWGFRYSTVSPFDSGECRECTVLPLCLGGCPAKPFHGIQSIQGHFCTRARYRLEELVRQQLTHRLLGVSGGGI